MLPLTVPYDSPPCDVGRKARYKRKYQVKLRLANEDATTHLGGGVRFSQYEVSDTDE